MTAMVKAHDGRGGPGAVKPVGSARLSRKNQVTLPVAALRAANLKPGDLLQLVRVQPGLIEIRRWRSRFADVVGTLPGFENDVDLEASRAGWDR